MSADNTIFRINKRNGNFTLIDNRVLENEELSWKAKAILCYLLSRPADWIVRLTDLINRSTNGEASVRSGLVELENAGYLTRKIKRNDDGTFKKWICYIFEDPSQNYFLESLEEEPLSEETEPDPENKEVDQEDTEPDIENPQLDEPDVDDPQKENPIVENQRPSNTEPTKTTNTNKTNLQTTTTIMEEDLVVVKKHWEKVIGTKVEDELNSDIIALFDFFSVDEIKTAIDKRSNASYYTVVKPELKCVPKCFFPYAATVRNDINRKVEDSEKVKKTEITFTYDQMIEIFQKNNLGGGNGMGYTTDDIFKSVEGKNEFKLRPENADLVKI